MKEWDLIMKLVYEYCYGEESYGLVYEDINGFHVYEIPQYGGEELFYKTFDNFEEAKKAAESYT